MKKISLKELNEILEKHQMWLKGKGGKRADLEGTNLKDVYLRNANLQYANLKDANLELVNLRGSNLRYANLQHANLQYTNLAEVNLEDANLIYANLKDANLRCANLKNSDLRYANLSYANLKGSYLEGVKTNINTIGYNLACPEKGSFIGYKKANECIVKLLIPKDAKRSSATTPKCRCDKAKVLEIKDIETGELIDKVSSDFNPKFIYKVGEIVSVDNFDDNRWNGCSTGIHFFVNKKNALNY